MGLVVRFKWIALSLVVPSPKHYNASPSDLHLSGAPNTGGRAGHADCCAQYKDRMCATNHTEVG